MVPPVVLVSLSVAPLLARGALWYTRRRSSFPSVAAMGLTVAGQAAA